MSIVRYAVVNPETLVVENITRGPIGFDIPERVLIASETANVGDVYSYGVFVKPEGQ